MAYKITMTPELESALHRVHEAYTMTRELIDKAPKNPTASDEWLYQQSLGEIWNRAASVSREVARQAPGAAQRERVKARRGEQAADDLM